MKLTRESVIMLVVLAGLVIGSYLGVYRPQARATAAVREQIATRKAQLATNSAQAAVVPDMVRKIEALKNRYTDFDSQLPQSKELGTFLKAIAAVQSQSDLAGGRMDTQNPVTGQLYNTMPISMRQTGPYLALTDFLRRVNEMDRLTRVQRLVIQMPRDGNSNELDIELTMNIYFTKG